MNKQWKLIKEAIGNNIDFFSNSVLTITLSSRWFQLIDLHKNGCNVCKNYKNCS